MEDNAIPVRATIVEELFQKEELLAWSLDLKPVEHASDTIKRWIGASLPPPKSNPEFRIALVQEWDGPPPDQLNNFMPSMHRHYVWNVLKK